MNSCVANDLIQLKMYHDTVISAHVPYFVHLNELGCCGFAQNVFFFAF